MINIDTYPLYNKQISKLKKKNIASWKRIEKRLARISETGNFGEHRNNIKGNICEFKINFDGGYRIYYFIRTQNIILLTNMGTKDTQQNDIEIAYIISEKLKEEKKNG